MPRIATIIALCAATLGSARALAIGPTVEEPPAQVLATPAPVSAPSAAPETHATGARTPDSRRPLGKPGPSPVVVPSASDAAPDAITAAGSAAASHDRAMPAWLNQVLALAGVVTLIFVVGSIVRRMAPAAGLIGALGPRGRAPSGVLEVLGRYPVSRQGMLVLLKVDRRVLLVSQTTGRSGHRMETLTEIVDPAEVASLVAKTADRDAPSRLFERAMDRLGADARPAEATEPAPRATAKPRAATTTAEATHLDGSAAARTLRARLATMQATPSPAASQATVPPTRPVREFTA